MTNTKNGQAAGLAKHFDEIQHIHGMANDLLEATDDLAVRWFADRVLDFMEAGIAEVEAEERAAARNAHTGAG